MLFGKTCAEPTPLPLSVRPIAKWNSGRDCWETDQIDMLSGRSVVFSETLPISGSMRSGVVYALPMSGHRTEGSGSSFSLPGELFPAPAASVANDGESTETWLARRERVKLTAANGNGMGMPLTIAVQLLPTPRSNEANGIGEHGTGGQDLRTTVSLLPSPRTTDGTNSMTAPAAMRHVEAGMGSLPEVVGYHLLPTQKAGDADFGMPRTSGRPPEKSTHLMTRMEYTKPETTWGPYAAAIERWEMVLGRPAPDPTEVGPKGGRRLSAAFVEWMMGLTDGWVTDPELGLSRTQQLRALGNGCVPQQVCVALKMMSL